MASVNAAAVRAADSLLRSVGGCQQVLLRTPAPAVPNDDGEQLGLTVPVFQDLVLSPVVYRRVRPKVAANNSVQYELLVSATAVNALVGTTAAFDTAATLFAVAFGVLIDGVLLQIESATYSEIGGAAYLYRLMLRVPAAVQT